MIMLRMAEFWIVCLLLSISVTVLLAVDDPTELPSQQLNATNIPCPEGKVRCRDDQCVFKSLCTSSTECTVEQFRCNNGRCINRNWICNGFDNCRDNSDEINCNCASTMRLCKNGLCVPRKRPCPGECRRYEHQCPDGKCVRMYSLCRVADKQCLEWGRHECNNHKHCYTDAERCDRFCTCADCEDEYRCFNDSQISKKWWLILLMAIAVPLVFCIYVAKRQGRRALNQTLMHAESGSANIQYQHNYSRTRRLGNTTSARRLIAALERPSNIYGAGRGPIITRVIRRPQSPVHDTPPPVENTNSRHLTEEHSEDLSDSSRTGLPPSYEEVINSNPTAGSLPPPPSYDVAVQGQTKA